MKNLSNIITTGDGSSTLFNEMVGDHYHSINGAETESQHVFINSGLKHIKSIKNELNILEVGVGTGLNLCLTYDYCIENNFKRVHYVALEPFPIDIDVSDKLEFEVLKKHSIRQFYKVFHSSKWDEKIYSNNGFITEKVKMKLQNFISEKSFDLIYYDAFGPSFQAEMWEKELISKICSMMSKKSVLVSYCAQGQFRRNLQECGLKVERLQGPPGKREMIRAVK